MERLWNEYTFNDLAGSKLRYELYILSITFFKFTIPDLVVVFCYFISIVSLVTTQANHETIST